MVVTRDVRLDETQRETLEHLRKPDRKVFGRARRLKAARHALEEREILERRRREVLISTLGKCNAIAVVARVLILCSKRAKGDAASSKDAPHRRSDDTTRQEPQSDVVKLNLHG